MPGVVSMENGGQNGVRTDHDRDLKLNGVNGAKPEAQQKIVDRTKPPEDHAATTTNGAGPELGQQTPASEQHTTDRPPRMNDLPDEIIHITQGFMPLSRLLTRLTQTTHNALQEKVAELAKMPIPATALNGAAAYPTSIPDDVSNENLRKKQALLTFAHEWHAKWVKALVITEWSRKSEMVSKLIDLKVHIDGERRLYDVALDDLVNVKRDLTFARLPSPDLKTALQVLSTGTASWIPHLDFIDPPSLTPNEQIKWINELNTLLSLRLNLEDFDKIPPQFRDYEIDSGRVIFKIPGEFEVDLTIADDDFEKQFWFIDFRFAFKPSTVAVPEPLKDALEKYVNYELSKDGLTGCYQFLHEFVLTHKIGELRRQAIELSQGSWAGTLKVEQLNRALAIQYWTSRTPPTGPKSWVLVAVNTGKQGGSSNAKSSSFLTAKWYRDNKEVKDVEIPLDVENLSAEALLSAVVGRHIDFILNSIHDKLRSTQRFECRQARMDLRVGQSDPANSILEVHVGFRHKVSLLMEPTTGLFSVRPLSKFSMNHEHLLNNGKTPAEDGVTCIENIRCAVMEDELNRRGTNMGWTLRPSPLSKEELRNLSRARDSTKLVWLRREGWEENWFVMVVLSLRGDEWWLLETRPQTIGHALKFQAKLPLNKGRLQMSSEFWNNLTLLTTGMIAQSVALRELHSNRIKSRPSETRNPSLPQAVRLPAVEIALSGIFPSMVFEPAETDLAKGSNEHSLATGDAGDLAAIATPTTSTVPTKQPWADNVVTLRFRGMRPPVAKPETESQGAAQFRPLACISDATIKVRKPAKFEFLKGITDPDVTYNPRRGEFHLRIRHGIGEPILSILKSRVKAVDRFVNFLESMEKAKGTIVSESITLRRVTFSYSIEGQAEGQGNATAPRRWGIALDLSQDNINIQLEKTNPHLRVVDLMRGLVNSEGGIEALMVWLPLSFPALNTVQQIEASWANIEAKEQGRVEFSMKSIQWMTIRYSLPGPKTERHLALSVRFRIRRGEAWWVVSRAEIPGEQQQDDEFTPLLKPIWLKKGGAWHGLTTSAAAPPKAGIVALLNAIDNAVRGLAGVPPDTSSQSMPMLNQGGRNNNGPQVVVLD